ncbi:Glutathione S-transferase family protein [Euphorbia peplus]|nr:Glutathione S-transferase family protein [Euphorbia peplus]
MSEVKLLGTWPSPYSYRVIWALKLKGIPFEYLEQDLANKSSLLLEYNPVHKKIPVLVHGGRPINESMIIVEYLDETWPHEHPLMPTHPYDRALARFWVKFMEDKGTSMWMIFRSTGEEQEKAVKATTEMLKTIEEEAMKLVIGENKYFGGDKIGIVDIAFGPIAHWLGVIEKVGGVEVLDPHKFPKLHKWTQSFKQDPIICENLPVEEEMIPFFKRRREMILATSASPFV